MFYSWSNFKLSNWSYVIYDLIFYDSQVNLNVDEDILFLVNWVTKI